MEVRKLRSRLFVFESICETRSRFRLQIVGNGDKEGLVDEWMIDGFANLRYYHAPLRHNVDE